MTSTTTLVEGDRVVVESGIYALGRLGTERHRIETHAGPYVGETGTISYGPDISGDFIVNFDDGRSNFFQPEGLIKVDDLDAVAAQRAPLKEGDKVRLIGDHYYATYAGRLDHYGESEAAIGTVGTVTGGGLNPGNVRVQWEDGKAGSSVVWAGTLERVVEEAPAFAIGDKVRVAYPAGVIEGETGSVHFGHETTGTVIEVDGIANGTPRVEAPTEDGRVIAQYVHPTYLTKVDEEPAEEAPQAYRVVKKSVHRFDIGQTVYKVGEWDSTYHDSALYGIRPDLTGATHPIDEDGKPAVQIMHADDVEPLLPALEDLDEDEQAAVEAQDAEEESNVIAFPRTLADLGSALVCADCEPDEDEDEDDEDLYPEDLSRRADALELAFRVVTDAAVYASEQGFQSAVDSAAISQAFFLILGDEESEEGDE